MIGNLLVCIFVSCLRVLFKYYHMSTSAFVLNIRMDVIFILLLYSSINNNLISSNEHFKHNMVSKFFAFCYHNNARTQITKSIQNSFPLN